QKIALHVMLSFRGMNPAAPENEGVDGQAPSARPPTSSPMDSPQEKSAPFTARDVSPCPKTTSRGVDGGTECDNGRSTKEGANAEEGRVGTGVVVRLRRGARLGAIPGAATRTAGACGEPERIHGE